LVSVLGDLQTEFTDLGRDRMPVHIHTMRDFCARALVLVPVPLLLGWGWGAESKDFELAQVSGRVT
jgi:hypothetical protein